ncbi:hypothetical protein [Amycolatopsis sp. YIM 10]|uniref:hypothetical protein n=1 Tax=Amycolatopsis sp. YIM 10 TaxID=2653857 RepID=UPI00129022D4|nr:hypothetical protein [Amycolatopsis sp. YIM 10]QFU92683.1 hypothetical protein YIM_37630 [Amycolatopsis sp. YIM 10]
MTGPGTPGQYPPQHPQQQYQQYHHPQYPQQHYAPGHPPPKKKLGLLIGILATVLVLVLAGVGIWVFTALDEPDGPPPVDASQDLQKAPGGCALFDEHEVKPYIPGQMKFEPTGFGSSSQLSEQGQCNWGNIDTFTKDKVPSAFMIATSYVFHATQTKSGVDAAKEHFKRSVRKGAAANVPGADEAVLVVDGKTDSSAEVTVRYRNVVYKVDYNNKAEGANVSSTATELANAAIGKVVPKTG